MLKNTPLARLVGAIQELVSGGSPMSPVIARKVARYFQSLPRSHDPTHDLSDREREVLDQIARGRTNKEISRHLAISPHTVDNHIRRVYEKLQVSNRAEATYKYLGRAAA
jgi:DNA-binding NarL/FixJ family response regulator